MYATETENIKKSFCGKRKQEIVITIKNIVV